jgi:single-stranded-DNA-specific exonuclease RecJ
MKTSILTYNWQMREFDERAVKTMTQRCEISEILARLLDMRGVALDEVENFLNPKIKTNLPNPFDLDGVLDGVLHVIEAIKQNKKITIFADYDVDGATSGALFVRFFRAINVEVDIYIPDRILEGYGPNSEALLKLKNSGTDLVIMADCGTVAFEPLLDAFEAGLEIIVIDHHLGALEKPKAISVINPNSIGEKFAHKNLCAAGVSFLFLVALNSKLREIGFYKNSNSNPPLEGSKSLANSAPHSHPPLEGGSKSLATLGRGYNKAILNNAKSLRSNTTSAENFLWYFLQNKQLNNCKFRRQQPIENYVVDFVCFEKKLIIELDGSQHGEGDKIKYDKARDEFLKKSGYRILRFWNNLVFDNIEDVLEEIFINLDPSPKSQATLTLPQGEGKITEPNLINLLDLVALGTVCDVMTLTGVNRAFVDAGLKIIAKRQNLGIKTICDLAALNEKPSAYHLGFVVGPRINAGGRIGKSDLGARLLSSDNEIEVLEIANQLEKLNQERKDIESQALEEAINNLEKGADGFSKNDAVIFAISKNYHQGIIGIVASRLKDKFEKPVCVIALDEENQKGKASCRSILGIDMGKEILNAKALGLLIEGGGHAMAGGFSVEINKIKELQEFFNKKLNAEIEKINSQKIKYYDIALDLPQVNVALLEELSKLEPFGNGNSKPKFLIRDVIKLRAKIVGQTREHVSCFFSCKNITGFSHNLQAIAFRSANSILGEILLDEKTKIFNLIGTLEINNYLGNSSVQMIIEDVII